MMNGLDWNKLLESHGAALVLYARQWTNSHADAEDAVQEGFVRFWKAGGVKDKGADALPYLFLSVKHSALDGIRSGNRRVLREEEVSELSTVTDRVFESDLETREKNQLIQAAMAKLSAPSSLLTEAPR